ncbi:IRK-interacting protein-like [Impatiens glandulifera]|uniref:IRK-interacting protein-like n=1 Tax=Impatiens glandulifera TaxID=253017 RepID=UPI001FB0C02A|nr:IRK-interacting protein-like [Impatiens glandulifera]
MNKTKLPSSSSSSSSLVSSSMASLSPPPPIFTPIQECEREGNDNQDSDEKTNKETRMHQGSENDGVSCNKCRPGNRDKISIVPVDNNGVSPNTGLLKSIFSSLTKKSPRTPSAEAELSQKLIQATKNRDDAVLEVSRLKSSVSNLEKKLNDLETYCHNLDSSKNQSFTVGNPDKVIKHFLISISESRSHVRILSHSMTIQIRQLGTKSLNRISSLLHPYDISISKNPKTLQFYLEAILNKSFFQDFESIGFHKSSQTQILNPIERCESNFKSFNNLQNLTWDEVLDKGTRYFSDEFSRFCDRKMNEVVTMLGWNRTWPESLLQAFFGASKWVWIVHLLANAVHPSLPVFRVEKGVRFESIYMEDMNDGGGGGAGENNRKTAPAMVRVMVAPGFYVYGNVVKCKVICSHGSEQG